MDDSFETISGRATPRAPSAYARLDTGARPERIIRQFVDRRAPAANTWRPQIDRLLGWIRGHIPLIVGVTILGAIGGYAFGALTPARYTTSSDILVDPAKLQVVADDIYDPGSAREAQLLDAEGKLRILTSGNVLKRVVDDLQLQNDPEFVPPPGTSLFSLGGSTTGPTDIELVAQRTLFDHVRARREERSFIVSLSVWSFDPQKAVTISNAFVRALLS
jgi:polysaccharide biosynthesis transport protein